MAETQPKPQNAAIATKDEEEPRRPPLFSLFPKFQLNFPPLNKRTTKPDVVVSEQSATSPLGAEEEKEEAKPKTYKPDVVKFPDTRQIIPPLKFEAEESEQSSSPTVLWQVYALGGFIILRWVWARWKERRSKNGSSDEEPSADDD